MKLKLLVFAILASAVVSGCDNGSVSKPSSNTGLNKTPESAGGQQTSDGFKVTPLSDSLSAPYATLPRPIGGACAFDQPRIEGDTLRISGYSFISEKDNALSEAVVLGVDVNGVEKFVAPIVQDREDVARFFKRPSLLKSGFFVAIDAGGVASGGKIKLYQVFQGKIFSCDNVLTIKSSR